MMRLQYHQGKNFGDQLNPLIFNYFFPGYFSEDSEGPTVLGIGSILGFSQKYAGKKIVFSSGFGDGASSTYGSLPKDLSAFDFISVRGPLTAQLLGLSDEQWVTDGAILLAGMNLKFPERKKVISFMPHLGSEAFYDHEIICKEMNWQFISASESVDVVLEKIANSSLVITEAMHGAIVADTLRVPWIPYVGFKTINSFKWQDWCGSMEMEYRPVHLTPYFSKSKVDELVRLRYGNGMFKFFAPVITILMGWWMKRVMSKNLKKLKRLEIGNDSFLSKDDVFANRLKRMLGKVEEFKNKYPI
jgi:succinoglycan biosynthesis protein ExoV